jgi:uncharacterized membrane protein YjgN (DUF898 family)
MSTTHGADTGPATQASDWDRLRTIAPAPTPPPEEVHAIEFSASGSEYFRIWIVNLLLTLVTLGLYYPWAKVRKLRYFYGNTRLAGHAFDFHGDPKRMLRGYLLVGALFLLYGFAGQVSPVAGVIALVILAAIWPALLRVSMRFRLAQTSWRGLRFAFTGDTAGAYKALLPAFAAAIVMVAFTTALAPAVDAAAPPRPPSGAALFGLFASMALVFAVAPLTLWLLKRYQHDNYQFASVRTRFVAGAGSFYALAAKAFGLVLLAAVGAGLLAAAVAFGAGRGLRSTGSLMVLAMVSVFAIYALVLFALQPYVTSRLQNLVWSRTRSRSIGFDSDLRFWPLARLMAVNWILVVLTLGLYWPFAAVALARRKLEAVSVSVQGDLDGLVARGGAASQDASGDAAADLFGVDLGL